MYVGDSSVNRDNRLLLIYAISEMHHVPVAALKRPDGVVQIPDLAAEIYPVLKGKPLARYRFCVLWFNDTGSPAPSGL